MPARIAAHPFRLRLRRDQQFYQELAFCNDAGIPHSQFLGGDGRWSESDRAKAIALRMEKALRCQRCGTADWEWDPKQGGDHEPYEATLHKCPGCYTLDISSRDVKTGPGEMVQLSPANTREAKERREQWLAIRRRDAEDRRIYGDDD